MDFKPGTGLFAILLTSMAAADPRGGTFLDMSTLAQAEEICYIDCSDFTTLENLDDLISDNALVPRQGINDGGGAVVLNPSTGIVRRRTFNASTWQGPYVNFQQGQIDGSDSDYDDGTPIDGWGNPIYFFSPLGLIEPMSGDTSLRLYGDQFDRYTLVSLGPDGIMSGDDLTYQFGGAITVPSVSSGRVEVTQSRSPQIRIRVKGYVLGSSSGTLLFDGSPAPVVTVESWTPTLATFLLAGLPAEGTLVSLQLAGGGTITRAVPVTLPIVGSFAAADASWELYR